MILNHDEAVFDSAQVGCRLKMRLVFCGIKKTEPAMPTRFFDFLLSRREIGNF